MIIREEKDSFKEMGKGILFCLLGIVIVVGITWLNGKMGNASMNLGQFSIGMGIKLFFDWHGCHIRYVSARNFRFYAASYFWSLSARLFQQ